MEETNMSKWAGKVPFASFSSKWPLFLALTLMVGQASARCILTQGLPVAPFADTEVVTNILLHVARTDIRRFDLHLELEGSPTNDLEVALGRDANTNGVLDVDEAETVYGWRGGRYFIENVREWDRFETETATNAPCGILDVQVENSPGIVPRRLSAVCGGSAAFAELADAPPAWLFRKEWDIMRIVRRGAGSPSDWVWCEVRYNSFALILR